MKSYILLFHLLGLVLCVFFASPALAEERVNKLTRDNVRAFIARTTAKTTGDFEGLSPHEVRDYLNRHIEDEARLKSLIKYHIPDMPMQEKPFVLTKDDFIGSIFEVAEKVDSHQNITEVKSVKILSRGKKALVKTLNTEYANMHVPSEGGDQQVPMEGKSDCTQVLSLNGGVIQIYSANCVTDIVFKKH